MTYCLGLLTASGLVFISDSRTNAGVDNVSTYTKMFEFGIPDERFFVLMTSGNLSLTQAVLSMVDDDIDLGAERNLYSLPSMYEVSRYLGSKTRQMLQADREVLSSRNISFDCQILLGGQIKGHPPALFLIYSEGNSIRATPETPFLQIGETKYGKTILDRAFRYDIDLPSAARCAIVSMDATIRSNLSVGPPIDIAVYENDALCLKRRRFQENSKFLLEFRRQWEQALQNVVSDMPLVPWDLD